MVVGSRLFNIPNAGDMAAGDWVPCAYGCGEMGSRMKIKLHERGDYCPRKLAIQQFEAMSTKDRTTVNGVSKEPIFEIGQVVAVFDNTPSLYDIWLLMFFMSKFISHQCLNPS